MGKRRKNERRVVVGHLQERNEKAFKPDKRTAVPCTRSTVRVGGDAADNSPRTADRSE